MLTPQVRTAIYSLGTAVLAVLAALNIIKQDDIPVWTDIVGTVLGMLSTLLAVVYRPTKKPLVEEVNNGNQ